MTVEYDEIGRRLKLSATGQTDVTYTYDKNSRLKTVTQGTQTVTLAYDDAGRRTSLTYPNGVVTSYGYHNANRLLSIDHIKSPTTIEALTYLNDAAGNRIKLTRANAAASLIPQAVTNTAFDAANEQTQFSSASPNLVYDNNGNLTSFTDGAGTTTYTWNARNQLTAISGPSLSASFVYDGLGRRKSKTINSSTTGFWYDGEDVLAELAGTTPTATYIRSLSIDEPFIRKQSGGDELFQTDALGSALALTDSTGSSGTTYTQEPFGKTTKTGTSTNTFQYTGREQDQTGLFYYRARYYSPILQRFITEDPIEYSSGDLNLYAYVINRPTAFVDPSGEAIPPLMLAGAALGGTFNLGATIVAAHVKGEPLEWRDYANAFLSGAISGAIGGIAGPIGGSTAMYFGRTASGLAAKLYTAVTAGNGNALGQLLANTVTGRKPTKGVLAAALYGFGGGAIGTIFSNPVNNSLKQASYFGPTFGNLIGALNPSSVSIGLSNAAGNIFTGIASFTD